MGFQPDLLDSARVDDPPRGPSMLEKLLALSMLYCGFDYRRAVDAVAEACSLNDERADRVADRLRKAMAQVPKDAPASTRGLHPVAALLQMLLTTNEGPLDLTPERTLKELYQAAMGDLTDVMSWDADGRPTMIPSQLLPPDKRGIVSEITHTVARDGTTSVKVKGIDKLKALELLAKHQGLLTEKINVTVDVTVADRLERARARVAGTLIEGEAEAVPALTHESALTREPSHHHHHHHHHERSHVGRYEIDLEENPTDDR